MKRSCSQNDKGFTLIESIIVIVVAALLGAMIVAYSGTPLTNSAQPLNQAKKAMSLQKVMESILADYNKNYTKELVALQTKIASSDSQLPPPDGYGPYTLVYNDFVKIVGNTEAPIDTGDPQDILKVTIKNDLGENLSVLLTKQ